MQTHGIKTIDLEKGQVALYGFEGLKLHAYATNDPLDDEVFIIENDGRGFVIEPPCFVDNISELEGYLASAGIAVEGIVAAYHMAGASFLKGVPVYGTAESDAYGHAGGGRALIDGFVQTFGSAFDGSVFTLTDVIEGDTLTLAGVELKIVRNSDAFDIEIPAMNAVYIHMMGHDCHSIVAGESHADVLVDQLEGFERRGFDMVLTSHYTPEGQKDIRQKKAYLLDLKRLAAESGSAASFRRNVLLRYPDYGGLNYLDMTAGLFFPQS